MTPQTCLRLIRFLGSVLLVTPFAAGLGGFDVLLWIAFWACFAMWHLGIQIPVWGQVMPIAPALLAQGGVVALLMGLGHGAGLWADAVLAPEVLVAIALAMVLLGRLLRRRIEAAVGAPDDTDNTR